MAINLNGALRWKSANADEAAMLADLQGNILKGHGRRATRHLFLRFKTDKARAKKFVRDISLLLISAHEQLRQADAFKIAKIDGGPFVGFFLTFAGYEALGIADKAPTQGSAGQVFKQGMRARAATLSDPSLAQLDRGYRGAIHAMVLIADPPDSPASWTSKHADDMETKILNLMNGAADVVASEAGRAIFNAAGEGLEHFGYVDGRSQPLLLVEDVQREHDSNGGTDKWNPEFPLKQVLVKDPGSASPNAFGSYFVFRKLEQNVKAFKDAEEALGTTLGSGELAGAMVVGRWENGTSVQISGTDAATTPISNNFNYSTDVGGARCPIHGHVRKTNPRGESAVKFGIPEADERAHLMARRGITYGRRAKIVDPQDEPSQGVGLLFMAYQCSLENQFEFTQASWANNENFLSPAGGGALATGRDPIIGQGGVSTLRHNKKWDNAGGGTADVAFGGFVTLKGGEYFFAPSKSMLAGV